MDQQAIFIAEGDIYVEATGELAPLSDESLDRIMEENPRSMIVGNTIGGYLTRIHNLHSREPGWTIIVTTPRPPRWPWPQDEIMGVPQIRHIGWGSKRPGRRTHKSEAHDILDFRHFHKATKHTHSMPDIVALFGSLRMFAHHMGIPIKPTAPGMAMNIVKSMPAFNLETKAQQKFARAALAKPLLNVFADTRKVYRRAVYLDQVRSWHVCAAAIRPPINAQWIEHSETHMRDQIAELLLTNGVHEVTLRSGEQVRLASNDGSLGMFNRQRAIKEVTRWHRGLGGHALFPLTRTHPIQDYAQEALELYDTVLSDRDMIHEGSVPTIKAILLSVYGLLGYKPRTIFSMGYLQGKASDMHIFQVHGETLKLATTHQRLGFHHGNAIVLAMLRDEMHRRTSKMMHRLRGLGYKVLAVFDDGIIVEADGKLPMLSEGWEIKHYIDDLVFFNEHNWRGDRLLRFGDGHFKETYLQEYKTLVEGRIVE